MKWQTNYNEYHSSVTEGMPFIIGIELNKRDHGDVWCYGGAIHLITIHIHFGMYVLKERKYERRI